MFVGSPDKNNRAIFICREQGLGKSIFVHDFFRVWRQDGICGGIRFFRGLATGSVSYSRAFSA